MQNFRVVDQDTKTVSKEGDDIKRTILSSLPIKNSHLIISDEDRFGLECVLDCNLKRKFPQQKIEVSIINRRFQTSDSID
jgi:hypothetical protein